MQDLNNTVNLEELFSLKNDENLTGNTLFEKVYNQALYEAYSIAHMIDLLLIPVQNDEEQNSIYEKIYSDLGLSFGQSYKICNMVIYALCHNMLNENVRMSTDDINVNLKIFKKWINSQETVDYEALSNVDKGIILCLSNGYDIDDIIEHNMLGNIGDSAYIHDYIRNEFPKHCKVKTLPEALGVLYISNADLRDTEKSFELLAAYKP